MENAWCHFYRYRIAIHVFDEAIRSDLKAYYQKCIDYCAQYYDDEQKKQLRSCGYKIA